MSHPHKSTVSRRRFLQSGASVATVGAVGGLASPAILIPGAIAQPADPLRPWAMAMHVHGSFSEGTASMESQLDQAVKCGVDVLWWTEHEFRMQASGARRVVHFNGSSESEDGISWTWTAASSGSFLEKSATYVTTPVSPTDPSGNSALRLVGRSNDGAYATYRLSAVEGNSTTRTSLDGTTLQIDVRPVTVGLDAFVAMTLTLSNRPAGGGQPAGTYTLQYRVGGNYPVGSRIQEGRTGVVTLAATVDTWTTLSLDPVADISAIWPWVDGRDSSLYTLTVGVGSRAGSRSEAYLDYLRISRVRKSGDQSLAVQAELMATYAPRFPSVTQHGATEWSMLKQHINWFGGELSLPPQTPTPWKADTSATALTAAIQRIQAAGGVASFNHPFGSGGGAPMSAAAQDSTRRTRATELIGQRCYGADILEVGYPVKGGVAISGYLSLWDALSRNGIFLTGTGVSDDHSGGNWLTLSTNFFTWAWATSTGRDVLTDALAAGRVYWGNPAAFRGQLDLVVDGYVPMGAVDVSSQETRALKIMATGLPGGSSVEIVRGQVDFAGSGYPDPVTTTTTLPASAFAAGSSEVSVSTTSSVFVRVVVRSSAGTVIAGSNPIWLLRSDPPLGIPLARRTGPPGPVGPNASFTWTASELDVQFDSAGTTPGDAALSTLAWDFGDGTTGTGAAPSHAFASAGTYEVILTVSDEAGLTSTVSRSVTVAEVSTAALSHVGSARYNANTISAQVSTPSDVQAGDFLLLFLTLNTTGRTVTPPAGWSKLGEQTIGTQVTQLFARTAEAGEAGSPVLVAIAGGYAKTALELLAYRGAATTGVELSLHSGLSALSAYPTPVGTVTAAGAWVVSYWVTKSSNGISAWASPSGISVRGSSFGTAGGALATLSADSGQPAPAGVCGGLVATSNATGSSSTTWTVVLRP